MKQDHSSQTPVIWRFARYFMRVWHDIRLPFLSSLVFGMLAYTFAFTNKLVNHDEVQSLFNKGATLPSGRWGLDVMEKILPNISMPWLYGILSILLIAAAICLIIRIFSIRSRILQVLLAGCVMVFPSLIGTFGYMFTSSSYAVAFLLAVAAVYLLQSKRKFLWLVALGCMVFSLSIYQAYISVAAGLLVVLLIARLLQNEKLSTVISSGVIYVVFLLLSLGGYYLSTKILLRLLHVRLNGYVSFDARLDLVSVMSNILLAYSKFLQFFTLKLWRLIPTDFACVVHIFCIAAVLGLLLLWGISQEKKEPLRYLLLVVLLALLPLAINCMYLFAKPDAVHSLVLYSFVSIYVLAAVTADISFSACSGKRWQTFLRPLLLDVIALCLGLTIAINTYIANAAYLNLHLRYENAYNFYSSLTAQIKQMPEFTPDTKLAILGSYQEPSFYWENFPFLNWLTGVNGFLPDNYSRGKFLEYYLAFPMPVPSAEETEAILASPEYAAMAVYPYYGSVQLIGDTIVVKLSN